MYPCRVGLVLWGCHPSGDACIMLTWWYEECGEWWVGRIYYTHTRVYTNDTAMGCHLVLTQCDTTYRFASFYLKQYITYVIQSFGISILYKHTMGTILIVLHISFGFRHTITDKYRKKNTSWTTSSSNSYILTISEKCIHIYTAVWYRYIMIEHCNSGRIS